MITLSTPEFVLVIIGSMFFGYLWFKLFGQLKINNELYHKGYMAAMDWTQKQIDRLKEK